MLDFSIDKVETIYLFLDGVLDVFMKTVDVRFLYQTETIYLFLDGVLDVFMKTVDVKISL